MKLFSLTLALITLLTFPMLSAAQLPSTLDGYLYLSQIETAFWSNEVPEEIIWFYSGDTLDGCVRSNDYIGIKQRPVFLGPVFSSQDAFIENTANAYFGYEPVFNVPEFEFPFEMDELQEVAEEMGHYFPGIDDGVELKTRVEGTLTGWHFYQWPADSILGPSTIVYEADIAYNTDVVIYVDSDLDIYGNHIQQSTTIVCDGYVRIIDNLKYREVGFNLPRVPDDSMSTLGLIASGDIHVANTEANGAGNGLNEGAGHTRMHCIITASLVSLNGSFSIENKNFAPGTDRYDGYYWCDPEGEHEGEPDRRGTLYFIGSMAQHRRDYIRTSNCGGTGYDKYFRYDHRLEELTPPLFDIALGVKEYPGNSASLPAGHKLKKAYPNPFNSSFNLNMTLMKRDQVKIRMINTLGQEVFSQNFGWMNVGDQRFTINMVDNPAGLYFAQVSTSSGFSETQKVIYMK